MAKKKPITVKAFLIPKLRRASRFWRAKNEARNKAKVVKTIGTLKNGSPKTKILFECNICKTLVEKDQGNIDHINPVVSLDGFTTWDDYINTLFCEADNLQHICSNCHQIKTDLEIEERKKRKHQKRLLTSGTDLGISKIHADKTISKRRKSKRT